MTQTVYFARCIAANGADMEAIKIGCSYGVPNRLKAVASLVPFDCELLAEIKGDMFLEYALHMWFRQERIAGEYFRASPRLVAAVDKISSAGKLPFALKGSWRDGPWIGMASAEAFLSRHELSLADVASVSGARLKSYQAHLEKSSKPNRKFVAAMTVAALEKGHTVRWPKDFAPHREVKEAA